MLTLIYPIVGSTGACASKECLIIWPMCGGTTTGRVRSMALKTICARWDERG